MDDCQTPPYAVEPLAPYLAPFEQIWEPAAGQGYMAGELFRRGHGVTSTDLSRGQDFFKMTHDYGHAIVTNPPFSKKYPWLRHCYKLGKPFALLMQIYVFGSSQAQAMFDEFGIEIILLSPRVDFKMPNKGWRGKSHFSVAWFTWKMNIGHTLTYGKLNKWKPERLEQFDRDRRKE